MKILAGIPTYHRQTAPELAVQLSRFVDKVIIVPQDTALPESPLYTLIPSERGTKSARNTILRVAREGKYDIVLQCDDDLKMSNDYLHLFLLSGQWLFNKGISSYCGKSRLVMFWEGQGYSNKQWEVRPKMDQLFMIDMKAVNIIGDFEFDLFDDKDYTLRLIKHGLIPAVFSRPKWTYNHTVTRHGKNEEAGGYSSQEIRSALPAALAKMNAKHGDLVTLTETKEGRHRTVFNWKAIRSLLPNLGLGYEDKKGVRV